MADAFFRGERTAGKRLTSSRLVRFPNTQRLRALMRERQGQNALTAAELTQLDGELEALAGMIELGG